MAWLSMIRMPGKSHRGPLPPADDELQRRATELRHHVAKLAEEIGERNVLRCPRELADASQYIEDQLTEFGFHVGRQEYQIAGVTCCNLEAEIQGASQPDEIIIVGAHYDSVVGVPGANDLPFFRPSKWAHAFTPGDAGSVVRTSSRC
jgi:acetylornithine deacetylase/succinyl-diaminopimelate desuccinylase-like protein